MLVRLLGLDSNQESGFVVESGVESDIFIQISDSSMRGPTQCHRVTKTVGLIRARKLRLNHSIQLSPA